MCQADRVKITCLYYYYLLLLLLLLLIIIIIIIIIILSLLTGILVGLVGRFGTPPDQRPPKQTLCDRTVIASYCAEVQSCLDSPFQLASFLAATARYSGNWLFSMLIAPCGLKLDKAFAVCLRQGLDLRVPHLCRYGSPVDARGLHSLSANRPLAGRSSRHHMLNDVVARAFAQLLGSQLPKSQLAWYAKTARDQMVSRWFLLKTASPWRETWQLFAPALQYADQGRWF